MMVLPLSLLRTAHNQPMMVELKNGETYSGILAVCDGFMNLQMRDVVCTSRDGDRFLRMPECYVRGSCVKYLRIPDEVIDMALEPPKRTGRDRASEGRGRGRGKAKGILPSKRGRGMA